MRLNARLNARQSIIMNLKDVKSCNFWMWQRERSGVVIDVNMVVFKVPALPLSARTR